MNSSSKNKIITSWFTHPQVILGVYVFLLSDEYSWSYIKKCSSKLYNGSEWGSRFWSPKKTSIHHKSAPHSTISSESMHLCKKNIHIKNVINHNLYPPLTVIHTFTREPKLWWEYASLARTKLCLQQRKTSLLLAYIEILWHFFFTNSHFVLLIRDQCFVVLSSMRFKILHPHSLPL